MHAFFQEIILRQSKPAKIGLPKGKKNKSTGESPWLAP